MRSTSIAMSPAGRPLTRGETSTVLAADSADGATYSDAKTADLVKGYLSYLVGTDGQAAAAKAAGSAPLSSSLSDEAAKQVDTIKAG